MGNGSDRHSHELRGADARRLERFRTAPFLLDQVREVVAPSRSQSTILGPAKLGWTAASLEARQSVGPCRPRRLDD